MRIPITAETGTYFQHENKIYASYGSWLVIFTYDLKQYGTNFRKVYNNIESFSKSYAQINKDRFQVIYMSKEKLGCKN